MEQAGLGGLVALHGAVVVEVIAGQIGERGQCNAHAVHAALLDADGGGLHGHCLGAGVAHGGQQAMHRQHIGRGQAATQCLTVGQHRPQRADGAAGLVIATQRVRDPLDRRGLAVGAGDGDHGKLGRRTVVPGIAQPAQQAAQASDLQQWDLAGLRQHGVVHGRFAQHRAGALRHGPFYIETSVAGQAGAGDEHIARLDLARVQLEMRGQRHALMQPRHGLFNRGGLGI